MAGAINSSPPIASSSQIVSRSQLYLLAPAIALISLFLVLPLSLIVIFSFLEPGTYGGVEWVFTTKAYVQFLFEEDFLTEALAFNADYLSIFLNSLLLAVVSTVLCLLIGFPTAYFIATRPERTRTIWLFAVTIPYWVNLLIRTVAMLFLLRDQGPINIFLMKLGVISEPLHIAYSNFAVGLGLFYSYLPFMVLPLYAVLEKMDETIPI